MCRAIVFIILMLAACNSGEKAEQPPKAILIVDSLKYSAHTWFYDRAQDQYEFYIGHHIRMHENGSFIAMRKENFQSAPEYVTGIMNDELRQQLDTLLAGKSYEPVYNYLQQPGHEYAGYYYTLTWYTGNTEKKIQFIPPAAPDAVKKITNLLDTLIFHTRTTTLDSIPLHKYTMELEEASKKVFPSFRKVDTTPSKIDAIRRF